MAAAHCHRRRRGHRRAVEVGTKSVQVTYSLRPSVVLALAGFAVLDGVPPGQAVVFIRQCYEPRAVETPWQRRSVANATSAR